MSAHTRKARSQDGSGVELSQTEYDVENRLGWRFGCYVRDERAETESKTARLERDHDYNERYHPHVPPEERNEKQDEVVGK